MTTITVSAHVDVDVDLADIDTDDLLAEMEGRDCKVPSHNPNALQNMFRALSLGDEKAALNMLRDYLCDALGRVL